MHPLDVMNRSLTKSDIRKLNMKRAARTREGYIRGRRSLERRKKAAGALVGTSGGIGTAGLALEAAKKYRVKISSKAGSYRAVATGDVLRELPDYKRRILQAKKYLHKVPKRLGYAVAALGTLGAAAGAVAHRRTKKKERKLIGLRESAKRLKKADEYARYKRKKKKVKYRRENPTGGRVAGTMGAVYGGGIGATIGTLAALGRKGRKAFFNPFEAPSMSTANLKRSLMRAAAGYIGGAALGGYGGAKAGARLGGGKKVRVKSSRRRRRK